MSRIVLGNRGSALALAQARAVLSELNAEWPDVHIVQKTVQRRGDEAEILEAVSAGSVNIALVALEKLPAALPEGLTLAAVTKRLEPRSAFVSRKYKGLDDLPKGAGVGVAQPRDGIFLHAHRKDLTPHLLSGNIDDDLALIVSGEVAALVLPAAHLIQLDRRQHVDILLEPEVLTPASGQGSLGLVVAEDDFLASDLAYTLQHRPSFDRVTAERSFTAACHARGDYAVGALAVVSGDGELHLFGALTDEEGNVAVQAQTSGEASEAQELGRELAQDVLEQIKQLAP